MAFPFAQISAGAKGNLGIILNNTFHLCKLKPRALATLKILSILTCFSRPRDQEQLCCPVQALGRQICITEYLRPPVQVLRRQSSAHTRYPRPPRQPGQCLAWQQGTWSTQPRGPMSAQPLPQTPLTPMHAEVTAVLVQGFQRGDIRSSRSNLIDPLDGLHHFVPLLLRKDGGALVLGNLLWGRNKIPVRSTSCSCSDSQSQLPHSFHGQVNFTAGLSSAWDHSEVANEAPDRSENIFIHLHFLSV